MRISLNWLQELVELKLSPEDLAETLTMAGFEVEDIEDRGTWADGVVIGKVLQREQHPNADKLSVCQVDVGKGENLNIVCGASNVRADIYVPVATVGTYLPNKDLKIKPAKLREYLLKDLFLGRIRFTYRCRRNSYFFWGKYQNRC